MLMILLVALLLSCVQQSIGVDNKNKWALIVAGSNDWENYRHQASVIHTYHILLKNQIPRNQIVMMIYDDIAGHRMNPFSGQVFNDYSFVNWYHDLVIDYHGKNVTPELFLKVLSGDPEVKRKGGKVLETGPGDNIFVFFSDHGGPNLVAFPGTALYSDDLLKTITWMYQNRRYKNMVLYVEACYSGSMFHDLLPENIGVYATTSANPWESGYGAFCDDQRFGTCLGGQYASAIHSTTEKMVMTGTLFEQYEAVRDLVTLSHVSEYGDKKNMRNMRISEFLGLPKPNSNNNKTSSLNGEMHLQGLLPGSETHLVGPQSRMLHAKTDSERELASSELQYFLKRSALIEQMFDYINKAVKTSNAKWGPMRNKLDTIACFRTIYDTISEKGYHIQKFPEVANYLNNFDSMCREGLDPSVVVDAINRIC